MHPFEFYLLSTQTIAVNRNQLRKFCFTVFIIVLVVELLSKGDCILDNAGAMIRKRDVIVCLVRCPTLLNIRRHIGLLPDSLDAKEVHRLVYAAHGILALPQFAANATQCRIYVSAKQNTAQG
jgi:hypothetical protein